MSDIIKQLQNIVNNPDEYTDYELSDIAAAGIARIRELESPWISVEDALPEINSRFLIYDTYYAGKRNDTRHCIQVGRMSNSWGIAPNGFNGECPTVTHWQPLPSPPE